jgi:hypothetical protein
MRGFGTLHPKPITLLVVVQPQMRSVVAIGKR